MSMDAEERQHLEKLRKTYLKRLRVLELQYAEKGKNSPPELIIEIEEWREKISEFDNKITDIDGAITQHFSENQDAYKHRERRFQIEIGFGFDIDHLSEQRMRAIVMAVAAIAEIPVEQVNITAILQGSVIFKLEMPESAIVKLFELYKSKDLLLSEIGVISLDIISESKFRRLTRKERAYIGREVREMREKRGISISGLTHRVYSTSEGIVDVNEAWLRRFESGVGVTINQQIFNALLYSLDASSREILSILNGLNSVEEIKLPQARNILNRVLNFLKPKESS